MHPLPVFVSISLAMSLFVAYAFTPYFVKKLTSRKVVIVPDTSSVTGHQFPAISTGVYQTAQWTLGTAVANVSVTIENG